MNNPFSTVMKPVYILFLFVVFFVNAQAQVNPAAKGKISGKVTDATNKQPVDYATVSVYKQGSTSPFNGISTDTKGNFTVDHIPAGEYKVTADFLGYQRATIEHVIVKDGNVSIGEIKLINPQ